MQLKMILNQLHQERDLRIQNAKTDLHLISSFLTSQRSTETQNDLEELCIRMQRDEQNLLGEPRLGDAPERPSL